MTLAAEPAIIGAVVTGALTRDDLATLPADAIAAPAWCARALALLLAALDLRAEGHAVPGPRHGRGLELRWVLALCRRAGVATWHRVPEDGYRRRTLADVVREAPRRPDALRALREVGLAAEDRRVEDVARARRGAAPEAMALQRAMRAWVAGDRGAALASVVAVERWIVGPMVDPAEATWSAEAMGCV